MASFRILNQFPVYQNRLGEPASGGTLRFYDTGTDNPKDVFGDPDLTVNNGPSVLVGSDGRTVDDIWGEGVYRVRLYDVDNTLIAESDNVELPGGAGSGIPDLVDGYFLTNDGALLLWAPISQLPDPSGASGKILGTDGVNFIWQAPPATPPPAVSDIAISGNGGTFSDGDHKLQILQGTATAPNIGGRGTQVDVTFATAFTNTPAVFVIPRFSGSVSAFANAPIPRISAVSATAFTAAFTAGELDDSNSGFNFNAEIPFDWIAFGQVAVA